MDIARTIGRIAAVLATVGALTALAGVAQAAAQAPPGMSQAEYRALILRSEGLNEEYGLGTQTAAVVTSGPTDATGGFAWGAFGIGAAAMLGLALVAGGLVVRRGLPVARRGATSSGTT